MKDYNDERVLSRRRARELTSGEIESVGGGSTITTVTNSFSGGKTTDDFYVD